MTTTPFRERFDLDITLRDAALDSENRPTRRMIANASIGMHVEDAYYSVRELREAVSWVHEGIPAGKGKLSEILANDGADDFQRCIYFCLAGRGVVAMLDDLEGGTVVPAGRVRPLAEALQRSLSAGKIEISGRRRVHAVAERFSPAAGVRLFLNRLESLEPTCR
jgi:hypothetical protein